MSYTNEEVSAPIKQSKPVGYTNEEVSKPQTSYTNEEVSKPLVQQMTPMTHPSLAQRFGLNFGESFRDTLVGGGVVEQTLSGRVAERRGFSAQSAADEAEAAGSDVGLGHTAEGQMSPYRGIPVAMLRQRADKAFTEARKQQMDHNVTEAVRRAAYEGMTPWYDEAGLFNKLISGGAAITGSLSGFLASPENWWTGGRAAAGVTREAGESVLSYAARRAAREAPTQAGITAGSDVIAQEQRIGRGEQAEFSPREVATSALAGGTIGSAFSLAHAVGGRAPARAPTVADAAETVGQVAARDVTEADIRAAAERQGVEYVPPAEIISQVGPEVVQMTEDGLELGDRARIANAIHEGAPGSIPEPESIDFAAMPEQAPESGVVLAEARGAAASPARRRAARVTKTQAELGQFAPRLGARGLWDDFRSWFAPQSVMPAFSKATAGIIREQAAALALATRQADFQLSKWRPVVDSMSAADRRAFMNAMEDDTVPFANPEQQAMGGKLRAMLKDIETKLQSVGFLEQARRNYFPHIWKDRKLAQQRLDQLEMMRRRQLARSPLKGSGSFLRQRTHDMIVDGEAAGLELLTDDPLQLVFLKLREEYKFYYGHLIFEEMKNRGLAIFYRFGEHTPHGVTKLLDPGADVWLPPAIVEHFTNFDPKIRGGLERVARMLGMPVHTERPLHDPYMRASGAMGYAVRPSSYGQAPRPVRVTTGGRNITVQEGATVARFGSAEETMMHEIGHQIDFKFHLADILSRDPRVWRELGDLALLRSPTSTDPAFIQYLLNPRERIANLFHALWHAPEVLDDTAPTARRALMRLGDNNPELKRIIEAVKPSVELTPEVRRERVAGRRYAGAYFAPDPVARIFNRYVQRSFISSSPLFDQWRRFQNSVSMLQLGLSGFHAVFEANDSAISSLSLGLDQAVKGEFSGAARSMGRGLVGLAPGPAQVRTWRLGKRLEEVAMEPWKGSPEERLIVQSLVHGGGRVGMDAFYAGLVGGPNGMGGFVRALKEGRLSAEVAAMWREAGPARPITVPLRVVARAFETSTELIMGELVPRLKLGVFYDAAEDWVRRNPSANIAQKRLAMGEIWDAVDDRMGQMVYDNLFWNKIVKDIAFLAFRAVGWNVGSLRALGGAPVDYAKFVADLARGRDAQWTRRMSYGPMLAVYGFLQGSILAYLMTGKPPSSLLGAYFPTTGRLTPYGTPERLSIPGYIKDVIEWTHDPVQTTLNKLNPEFAIASQLWQNRDYYGALIHDPLDSFGVQALSVGQWLAQQALPFSVRGYQRLAHEDTAMWMRFLSFFGLNPAPASISSPQVGEAARRRADQLARRRRAREVAKGYSWPSFITGR